MAWYDAGTVNVTLNSATVTGVGTQWVAGARQGEAFVGPDGRLYEVMNIASDTALTLTRPYRGATQAAQPYALAPFQGYVKELADRAAQLLSEYGTATDEEALARSSATKALSPRGLGLNVLQDPYATTPGLLLQNSSHGVGSMSKTWRVGSTASGTSWLALCDVIGAASDRGTIILSGGYGFNSGTNQGSCTTVLSLTMGNSGSDDNLLVRGLQLFDNSGIQQLRTAWLPETERWRVWVRATPFTTLVASYSGNLVCTPLTDIPYFDIPGAYEKPVAPAWSAYNFDPASKADLSALKSAAFADLIGDVGAGAAMQSGTSANGSWAKYADGTMRTWRQLPINMAGTTWTGSTPRYCAVSGTVQFPAAFLAGTEPVVTIGVRDSVVAGRSAYLASYALSNSSISGIYLASPNSAAAAGGTVTLDISAEGYWK